MAPHLRGLVSSDVSHMTSIIMQVIMLYVEILMLSIGLLGLFWLLREYFRPGGSMGFMLAGFSLACTGLSQGIVLLGQILVVKDFIETGELLIRLQGIFVLVGALIMALYTSSVFFRRHRRTAQILSILAILPFTINFYRSGLGLSENVYGAMFPSASVSEFFSYLLPLLLSYLYLSAMATVRYVRRRQQADLLLMLSGLVGFSSMFFAAAAFNAHFRPGAVLFGVELLIHQVLFLCGALGHGNSDKEVEKRPLTFFRQNIQKQIASFSLPIFFIFTLAISAINTGNQVRAENARDATSGEWVLRQDASTFQAWQAEAQREADLLSSILPGVDDDGGVVSVLTAWAVSRPSWALELVWSDGNRLSAGPEFMLDPDASALDVTVPVKFAIGQAGSDTGTDFAPTGTLRMVRPIDLDGLLLPSFAAGFQTVGIVVADSGFMYQAGADLNSESMSVINAALAQSSGFTNGQTEGISLYQATNILTPDGKSAGYMYYAVSQIESERHMFSALANVAVISLLIGIALLLTVYIPIRLLVRPVVELERAAKKIKSGDYSSRIQYGGPNEFGRMAVAFNKMSEEVKKRTASLQDMIREQRDFLNYVVHELKAPVTTVRWSLESLMDENAAAESKKAVSDALRANDNIRELIDELLDFSRMERGAIKLELGKVEIRGVLDDVVNKLSARIEEAGVRVSVSTDGRDKYEVHADANRVAHMLSNLIGNAVKYSPRGGDVNISLEGARLSGPSRRSGKFVRVSVQDRGLGVPKSQQKQIFSRFFRAENAVASGAEGTGLGLYIARRLAELQGGELWFDSTEGRGSTFKFTLPMEGKHE